MDKWKRILNKLLFPGAAVIIVNIPISAALLIYTFAFAHDLSGVIVLVIEKNEGFEYAGYLIYVIAMYTFYTATVAVINIVKIVKYKKYQIPVILAAKAISLASALVAVLSLETAMLSQFGDKNNLEFRLVMMAATGAGVCAIILGMAVFMIIHAMNRLKTLQANHTNL